MRPRLEGLRVAGEAGTVVLGDAPCDSTAAVRFEAPSSRTCVSATGRLPLLPPRNWSAAIRHAPDVEGSTTAM